MSENNKIILYQDDNEIIRVSVRFSDEDLWLTQNQLAEIYCTTQQNIIGERPKKEIGVQAIRGGDVVGVHTVYFMGPGERIEVTHHAHSRENFAQGALRAASWLPGQPGGKVYAMGDILKSRLK